MPSTGHGMRPGLATDVRIAQRNAAPAMPPAAINDRRVHPTGHGTIDGRPTGDTVVVAQLALADRRGHHDEFAGGSRSYLPMKRAAELFTFERCSSPSSFVDEVWQTRSEPEASFISVAATHWEIVVTRHRDAARLTVRGPETRATIVPIPQDAEFFGIEFSLGTFMPALAPRQLVDRALELPLVTPNSFWLDGSAWELPRYDEADVFVDRLTRAGLLVHDPVVPAALDGDVAGLSGRSVERRVSRATGLTQGAIRQMRRADRALELLTRGVSAPDAASQAGYADQAHLVRSLRRFVGQTPSQLPTSAGR
jgi:hypothetical protein